MMVKTFLFFSLGALLLHLPAGTQAWRILISAPTGTKSYHNMFVSLATEMSHRGHHVTVISNYKSSDLEKAVNVRQITLEKLAFNMSKYPNQFEANVSPAVMLKGIQSFINAFRELPIKITETLYSDQNVKELIANESFDLVMVSISFNSASYSLGWHFNAPVIMLTPNSIFPGVVDALGDNDHPEYVPFFLGSFTDRMSLFQRTINTVATYFYSYFAHKYHQPACLSYIRQTIMPESPSLQDLERNISLIFTNSHPAINYPRALPPQIIEVGGIHCRPARPLPQDLETFVSHPDGFILFAIGSTLPMEIMPDYLMEAFIQTFAQLPQRVIWQWKGKIRANLPENVLALSWLPQQDLLGHKNCKLFITHGGLNSIQEAVYHGIPLLGLPLGTDQRLNIRRAVDSGYALQLSWHELNRETLEQTIHSLLHDSKYSDAVSKLSEVFRNQLETPLERALYWTEYIIRNRGAEHLRLGSRDLAPYQRSLVDVYILLAILATFPLILVVSCLKGCCGTKKMPRAVKK